MNIKLILISIIGVAVLLLVVINAQTEEVFDLYTDAQYVNYNEVLDEKEIPTVYYYYRATCGFCNSIKDQVTNFYLALEDEDNIDMKLIDINRAENKKVLVKDKENFDPNDLDMSNAENIKIVGTPSMIFVENGEVVEYKIGVDLFDIMESINDQYNLRLEFDRSKYSDS